MNKKLSYEAPRTTAYKIEASSAILAASGGWTNSDKEHGFDIVGEIPRSDEINRCEDQGKTVIEGNPESDISKCFYDLAEILWKDEEQV